jgi:hypothetical protein
MTPRETERLQALSQQIVSAYWEAYNMLRGRRCKVRRSRFHGRVQHDREGEISGLHICPERGLQPCVSVFRLGTDEHLNSAPDTRSCWPLDNLEIT